MSALKHDPSGQAFYQLIQKGMRALSNQSLKDLSNYPIINPARLTTDHGLYEALSVYFGVMIAAMSFRPGIEHDQIKKVVAFIKGPAMRALRNHVYTLDNENNARYQAYEEVERVNDAFR